MSNTLFYKLNVTSLVMLTSLSSAVNAAQLGPTQSSLVKSVKVLEAGETNHAKQASIQMNQFISSFVFVEGGAFTMGSNDKGADSREKPAHQVYLDSFYMSKTEITQGIFEQIAGYNVSYFQCETCPVNNVSWMNIQKFITKLNALTGKQFRLPTEAEWEYAAKGGKYSKGYEYSGSNNISEVAWYVENANRKLHPVAQKAPNELGIFDMTGNVWEFCLDDMDLNLYTTKARTNPIYSLGRADHEKTLKVVRGSGYEFSADESQVFRRDGATNNVRMPDIGFRLVLDDNNE